jgi:hypothetical protein
MRLRPQSPLRQQTRLRPLRASLLVVQIVGTQLISKLLKDKSFMPELCAQERFAAASAEAKRRRVSEPALAGEKRRGKQPGAEFGCSKCRWARYGCLGCNALKKAAYDAHTAAKAGAMANAPQA